MSVLEKFETLGNVCVLNEEQQLKINGGGDPPPWPDLDDEDDDK